MRRFYRYFAGVVSLGIASVLTLTLYIQHSLPDYYYVVEDQELVFSYSRFPVNSVRRYSNNPEQVIEAGADISGVIYQTDLKLFDAIALKQVQVQSVQRKLVVPGGVPFGIKMFTDGVVVVAMSDIQVGMESINPAKDAGIKIGDVIMSIDGIAVNRNEDVAQIIAESDGTALDIQLLRDGAHLEITVVPVQNDHDQTYRIGVWVRDSSAGIGTITYYDPQSLVFAGLGHAVCDVDTGEMLPLSFGEIVDVNITGANIGTSGKPGELKGVFVSDQPMGYLYSNCETGVYGVLEEELPFGQAIPMSLKQEVQTGPATILTSISGNKPQSFDIFIEKVNASDINPTKNMVIRVVDEDIKAKTGGIVQGMSGSPIIQNGMLVGAVTHVFVNDPTRGYGIFAENMNIEAEYVKNSIN